MIDYVVEDVAYTFSYRQVRQKYLDYCAMTDSMFKEQIAGAIHLACIICYFKEIPPVECLSDRGIVHELAHINHLGEDNTRPLSEVRKMFEEVLKLA